MLVDHNEQVTRNEVHRFKRNTVGVRGIPAQPGVPLTKTRFEPHLNNLGRLDVHGFLVRSNSAFEPSQTRSSHGHDTRNNAGFFRSEIGISEE